MRTETKFTASYQVELLSCCKEVEDLYLVGFRLLDIRVRDTLPQLNAKISVRVKQWSHDNTGCELFVLLRCPHCCLLSRKNILRSRTLCRPTQTNDQPRRFWTHSASITLSLCLAQTIIHVGNFLGRIRRLGGKHCRIARRRHSAAV